MTTPKEYRMIRVSPDTHRKLRILAAHAEESIIDLIDRLVTQEQERINDQPASIHIRFVRPSDE